jgi:hypothetical protein
MDPASFYRPVDAQLCQGDILRFAPHLLLKQPPQALRKTTSRGNKSVYELEELPVPPVSLPSEGVLVPVPCQVTWGILLTHDCEVDKDRKHRTVAMIRTIPAEMPDNDRAIIKQNQRFPFYYLPPLADIPESYVDFRRISTLSPEIVDSATRFASLSQEARQAMLLQFFRYMARVELEPQVFGNP